MRYVSERIINISKLEQTIKMAKFHSDVLLEEIAKAAPSVPTIDAAARTLNALLDQAQKFEFCLEQRMCDFKEVSENHGFLESR